MKIIAFFLRFFCCVGNFFCGFSAKTLFLNPNFAENPQFGYKQYDFCGKSAIFRNLIPKIRNQLIVLLPIFVSEIEMRNE